MTASWWLQVHLKERYRTVSGKIISHERDRHQISSILTGLYSLGGRDRASVPRCPTRSSGISYMKACRTSIIVLMGYPVMAMLRLPTRPSGGRPTCTRARSAWV